MARTIVRSAAARGKHPPLPETAERVRRCSMVNPRDLRNPGRPRVVKERSRRSRGRAGMKPLIRVLAFLCLLAPVSSARVRERKPNIIFILADDLGYGDPGCYG